MAGVSGLTMPAWLLLLAKSLETFNSIGKLVNTIGGEATLELLIDQLYQLCWSFAVVGGVSLVSGTTYVAIWTYTGENQALRIRQQFVRGAFRQDSTWFDMMGDPQELPTLAANALAGINDAIGRKMADGVANLLSAVFCLAVAIGLNPPLALIMLCVLPVVAIVVAIISCFMRRRNSQALDAYATGGAFSTEVISGIKTVASLSAERWAAKKYEGISRRGQKYSIWSGFLTKVTAGAMGVIFYVTYTFAFLLGTEQVAQKEEIGESHLNPFYCIINYCGVGGSEVMVCIYGVILCAQFFSLMAPSIQAINVGRSAAVDIFGAIRRKPEIDAMSDDGAKLDMFKGALEFRNVVFSYPSRPSDIIFKNFNLKIGAGSSVALVGPSGSGKSTISKLLLRFYDPLAGAILADGVPLKGLNLKWWRSRIGYVQQEPSLFPGTIRDNIAMGKCDDEDVSEEDVIAAAKAASAHEFIMELPDKYDTFYAGASIQLSGGQVQRIAIARALIRQPQILILDEATSALDTQSEKAVQSALANIRNHQKVTTVTVAHRLSTIINSDQIAVISDGMVQQQGTHVQLLEEGGIYSVLCKSQGLTAESLAAGDEEIAEEDAKAITPDESLPTGDAKDIEAAEEQAPDDVASVLSEEEEQTASLARLWQYNKAEWAYMLLGVIGAVIVGALAPSEGILFAQLTANFFELTSEEMREENPRLCFYFLILGVASLLGNMAMGCGFSVSGHRLTRRMRVLVFDKIMRHGMGWFDFPENSTGELTHRLEEDAEAVSKVTGWSLGQQVQVMSSLVTGLTVSLVFSWQIGLIAIACVPVIMCAGIIQASCTKYTVEEQEGLSAATILERGLHEIALVQAYGIQTDVGDQYCEALKPDADNKVKQGTRAGLVFGVSQCAIFGTFGLLFYCGIQLMVNQKVSFTDFFASLLAVMFAAIAIGQTSVDFTSNHKGLAAAARMFAIVDEPDDEDDPMLSIGSKPDSVVGNVSFKSVGFSYPTRPGHPVYYPSGERDGFNLDINCKESVAFVGRSGCGKSTALQLLLRFYRPSEGQVLLDNNSVDSLNLSWLRENIGYVGQQPVLFAGTVRENILLGKRNATEAEIVNAAKAANAHEFISQLSSGYYTDIGAGGSLLSGGQKQRIAIARAIIKDPQILVLDEATSALDNESERVVQAALDEMQKTKPRTTLVVAHRLTIVKECNKIAVLEDGGVVECGSHSELIEQEGLYHDLWKKQGVDQTS